MSKREAGGGREGERGEREGERISAPLPLNWRSTSRAAAARNSPRCGEGGERECRRFWGGESRAVARDGGKEGGRVRGLDELAKKEEQECYSSRPRC